jgi:MFS transporter, FSR family, fosmidomycin resistance protein
MAGGPQADIEEKSAFAILGALSFCHLLNDMMQSLVPSIYPIIKQSYGFNFTEIGIITLTFQASASVLQPMVGFYTDKSPKPYSLVVGMGLTLGGLVLLSVSTNLSMILVSVGLMGLGSSVFHPESSRMARLASGGRHGLAQSVFQVGGNAGLSLGPLLAAFIVAPRGQRSIAWFGVAAIVGMVVLTRIGNWYKTHRLAKAKGKSHSAKAVLPRSKIILSLAILLALILSKYIYLSSINTFYTFYLIHKFNLSIQSAQIYLFIFLFSVAVGTIVGGPVGDRIGRKYVIWGSILGVLPFTLLLPYANLLWTAVLTVFIGLILASAFSAIVVYAQELLPGKVGTIAGLFFGLAFGASAVGAAFLGKLADITGIDTIYHVCSFLPLIGLLTAFLPDPEKAARRQQVAAASPEKTV